MSRPGWYPDPYGTGSLRWWDGRNWTERLNPEPDRPPRLRLPAQEQRPQEQDDAPDEPAYGTHYAAPHVQEPSWDARPALRPLDVDVRGLQLYADDRFVAYGQASLAWPHVEWVAYWAAERPAGYGHTGSSDTGCTQWVFQAGRYPFRGGPRVEVVIEQEAMASGTGPPGQPGRPGRPPGRDGEPEHVWGRLIQLCQEHAERRLVAELARRVRAGESIDVAQGLTVHPGGVRGNRVSLSWSAISGATVDGGRVWIQQSSSASPVLYVPQQNPNAVLIPSLLARLRV